MPQSHPATPTRRRAVLRTARHLAAGLALLLPATPLLAGELAGSTEITAAVERFLDQAARANGPQERLEVEVGRIDRRLRLAACPAPLETELAPGAKLSGRTTVAVACPDPSWRIYVPAQIKRYAPVVVARTTLPRGLPIRDDQIELAEREISRLPFGYIGDPAQAVGRLPSRPIAAGQALNPRQVTRPKVVRRGERVTITAAGGTFHVEMTGEALGDAARGERVRVRALGSERVVEGTVTGPGQVQAL